MAESVEAYRCIFTKLQFYELRSSKGDSHFLSKMNVRLDQIGRFITSK